MADKIKQILFEQLQGFTKLKADNSYLGYQSWLLSRAKTFTGFDEGLSKDIAKSKNAKVKQCYYNAWSLAWNPDYEYHEGYVIDDQLPFPIEHAFCVRNGVVVDTTLGMDQTTIKKQMKKEYKFSQKDVDRFHKERTGIEYFGVKIPMKFVNEIYVKSQMSNSVIYDYYREMKI